MARLTNAIRADIVSAIVKYTFRVRGADLEREETLLAFEIRDEFLGAFRRVFRLQSPQLDHLARSLPRSVAHI